jgi:hypothetical protein
LPDFTVSFPQEETLPSPPVLLGIEADDPNDPLTVQEEVPPP